MKRNPIKIEKYFEYLNPGMTIKYEPFYFGEVEFFTANLFVCYLFCSIFILLSQESDGSAIFWTNPHPLRSCSFPSFPVVSLTSYH